ncbi:hypothetical protein [Methylomonas sp. AM2-LC]|uniref:hypothetical protein n=1 Tax=Methylomonas sp. AM2-LC TaxID=3153301 RepID=UPI0032631FDD
MTTANVKQVSMKVNQTNLVKSLKLSFTNKYTFIGEIMQNSRRAGSTYVSFNYFPDTKILKVTDDGCGIDSIETLLTVAESGWEADVIANEHPFGIGFLSALFACKNMTLVSKGGRFSVDTDKVLNFQPVTVYPIDDWDGITSILMIGVDFSEKELERLSIGFSIPVLLNGNELLRPHAIDSLRDFVKTEIGSICLYGLNKGDSAYYCRNFVFYLQGLPIYKSRNSNEGNIIHLDSSMFFARLPDRDKLIDEKEVIEQVMAAVKKQFLTTLNLEKLSLPMEQFLSYYEIMSRWNILEVLDDYEWLPKQAVTIYDDYPNSEPDNFGQYESCPGSHISKEEFLSGRKIFSFDEYFHDEGSNAFKMFLFNKEYLCCNKNKVSKKHWINQFLIDLDSLSPDIEIQGLKSTVYFNGNYASERVRFCDSYSITILGDVATFHDNAMYTGSEFIIPNREKSGQVISQFSTYMTNYTFQESSYNDDCESFRQFVAANKFDNPQDALKALMPSFSGCPSVFGKSFVIKIGNQGNVSEVIEQLAVK